MRPFAIAGVQMYLSASHSNIDAMKKRIDILMGLYPWVEMIVFSELAPLGPFMKHATEFPCAAEKEFQASAAKHGIWLLPGSMFERVGNKVFNTASVINPQGEVVTRYRKMFPFYPYENGVEGGQEFCVFDVPEVGRFGVSICYDMWFAETTRTLCAMGAEVILHPTLTATIDRDVELSITRAAAATNQCFFFDINGAGECGNGRSLMVGPAGDVLHQAGHGDEMVPLEIDLDRVRRSRIVGLRGLGQPLKSFRDRRVDFKIYRDPACVGEYLHTLGDLEKPERGTRVGLDESLLSPSEKNIPVPTYEKYITEHHSNAVTPVEHFPNPIPPVAPPIAPPAASIAPAATATATPVSPAPPVNPETKKGL